MGEARDELPFLLHACAVEALHDVAELLRAAARKVLGTHLVEGGPEGITIGEAAGGVLVEGRREGQAQGRWYQRPAARDEAAHPDDLPDLVAVHVAVEAIAGQQLVEGHGGGELVAAAVDVVTAGLLGRHVRDLAHHDPGLCVLCLQGTLGEAEVDELHLAFEADHDVGWRDVAVDDAQRLLRRRTAQTMGMSEGAKDGVADDDREAGLQGLFQGRLEFLEVHPVDELHRQEAVVANDADFVDRRDVRVIELADDTRLVEKAAHVLLIRRQIPAQRLDNDEALAFTDPLLGQIDIAHAAPTKGREQRVAAEGAWEAFDNAEHASRYQVRDPRWTRPSARAFLGTMCTSFPVLAFVVLVGMAGATAAAAADTPTKPTLAMLPLRATDLPTNEVVRLNTLLRARAATRGGYEVQAAELTNDLVDAAQGLGLDCAVDTVACGTELGKIVDVRFVLLGQAAGIAGGEGVGVDVSLVDVAAGTLVRRLRARLPQAIEARTDGANALADLVFGQGPLWSAEVTIAPLAPDAVVIVDGLVAGQGPGPVTVAALAPGPHRLEVRARRFLPFVLQIDGSGGVVPVPVSLVIDKDAEVEVVSSGVKVAAFVAGGVGAAVAVAGGVMLGVGLQPWFEHGQATADLAALDRSNPGYPALAQAEYTRAAGATAAWELWGGPLTVAGSVALGLGVTAAVAGLGWGTALVLSPPIPDEG